MQSKINKIECKLKDAQTDMNYYKSVELETELKKEVGDVYAMLELLVEWDVLSWTEIENRRDVKRMKLSRWSDLIGESESRLYAEENSDAWRKAMGDIPEVTGK